MARTHHKYAWAGLIDRLLEKDPQQIAKNTDLLALVHFTSTREDALTLWPQAYAGTPEAPNDLIRSVSIAAPKSRGQWSDVHHTWYGAIRDEYQHTIEPLLVKFASDSDEPGPILNLLTRLRTDVLGSDAVLTDVLRDMRDLMRKSVPPLRLYREFEDDAHRAALEEEQLAANAAAATLTVDTVLQRPPRVYPSYVDNFIQFCFPTWFFIHVCFNPNTGTPTWTGRC